MTLLKHLRREQVLCTPSRPLQKQKQCFGSLSEFSGCNITWYEGSSIMGANLVASPSYGRRNARKGMG
jgi:hypothetical protein